MSKRKVSGIMLMLLLASMLPLASEIQPVKAIGTIYIRADGSIDPPTAPIQRDEDVYTLTGNITGSESAIVIGRDDMILNGAGYAVQGTGVFNSIGISLLGRYNVTIKSMKIVSFDMGVLLNEGSAYNNIAENIITANNEGILLYDFSFSNNISGNSITHNNLGIGQLGMTEFPSNNVLRNNSMVNNTCNFSIDGLHLLNFLNDIDVSNTVDGRPIYYWVNKLDMVVPLNAGYVALINCTRITVQNLTLTKNGQGILLASTTNSTITKNSIANNDKGIRLRLSSSNNSIFENNITANDHEGILLDYGSSNSSISRNNVTANGGRGIFLESSYSIVSGNSITSNNQQGIFFYHSSHISISGNNVTANRRGGICDDYSSSNSISGNKIAANDRYGIEVVLSSDNSIYGNDLTDNEIGIYLYESSNNFIYHNNFINNTKQVYDYSWDHPSIPPSINSWDDGYPSGATIGATMLILICTVVLIRTKLEVTE